MIIVVLMGGLGNQLFQYAAARSLADRTMGALRFDLSAMGRHSTTRPFLLHHFRVRGAVTRVMSQEFLCATLKSPISRLMQRHYRRCMHYCFTEMKEKPDLRFEPALLAARGNVVLSGYWQSETYFADDAVRIRGDLALRHEPDAATRACLRQIRQCDSVSIHVRRGDYVSDQQTAAFHGICSVEYYHGAMRHIAARIERPQFFVFSDDPEWARANIRSSVPTTYVSHNDATRPHEDLRLMSACKHHIIANSSLSWWGAWLNPAMDKIVVAPRRWCLSPEWNTTNVVPASWVRI